MGGAVKRAIVCDAASPLIVNNQIRLGEPAIGIECSNSSNPVIANNYLLGNTRSLWAIKGNRAGLLTITNNIIKGHATAIFNDTRGTPGTALIENNIILDNGIALRCEEDASIESSYNLFWNNGGNYAGCSAGQGDLEAGPIFHAPETEDFRLKEESPAIDAGDPEPQYDDIDGSRNDIGIYGGPYAEVGGRLGVQVKLSIPDTLAAPGDTLHLPVWAFNASGIARAEMVLTRVSS